MKKKIYHSSFRFSSSFPALLNKVAKVLGISRSDSIELAIKELAQKFNISGGK